MSGKQRERLESPIQAEIEAALGAEPDLLLLRNTVGHVQYFDKKTGEARHITYGLGKGSPDLVGILSGRWFCLEIKTIGGAFEKDQLPVHEIWRRFGALVFVVHSAAEALEALAIARLGIGMAAAR